MADQKDTIYIDVDDEITSIIEKVHASKHKILALVLPKRATTLQSIVNMKLLKRTADEQKKHLVLITSEAGLLPLAGAVKLHVAKTLQSKPAIPPPPDVSKQTEPLVADGPDPEDPELDAEKSVGELAGLPAEKLAKTDGNEETIDIDNADDAAGDKTKDDKKAKKDKKGKNKISVPNFERFRLRLLIGGAALILLIVLWILANIILPKASIAIQTDNTTVSDNITFSTSAAAKTLDPATSIVPAEIKDEKKTDTQQVTATGSQNVGASASGTMTIYYCPSDNTPQVTVPAGTPFTSNGTTFLTNGDTVVPASNFTGGGNCKKDLSQSVGVTASQPGSQSNIASTAYGSAIGGVSGKGSDMTGGTDKTVTVVSQADIDGATQKIVNNQASASNDLSALLKADGKLPLPTTLVAGTPSVTTSAKAGDQASTVTVTAVTDYNMLGVNQADLQTLVQNDVKKQIDTSKQQISDYGLSKAVYTVTAKKTNDQQTLSLQTTVTTGAKIDPASLKVQIAGKKKGDVEQIINNLPSVKNVTVKYSPFWVDSTPKKISKITITIQNASSK